MSSTDEVPSDELLCGFQGARERAKHKPLGKATLDGTAAKSQITALASCLGTSRSPTLSGTAIRRYFGPRAYWGLPAHEASSKNVAGLWPVFNPHPPGPGREVVGGSHSSVTQWWTCSSHPRPDGSYNRSASRRKVRHGGWVVLHVMQ